MPPPRRASARKSTRASGKTDQGVVQEDKAATAVAEDSNKEDANSEQKAEDKVDLDDKTEGGMVVGEAGDVKDRVGVSKGDDTVEASKMDDTAEASNVDDTVEASKMDDTAEASKEGAECRGVVFQFDESAVLFEFQLPEGEAGHDSEESIGTVKPSCIVVNSKGDCIPAADCETADGIAKYVQVGDELICTVAKKGNLAKFVYVEEEEEEIVESGETRHTSKKVEIQPEWSADKALLVITGKEDREEPMEEKEDLDIDEIGAMEGQLDNIFEDEIDEIQVIGEVKKPPPPPKISKKSLSRKPSPKREARSSTLADRSKGAVKVVNPKVVNPKVVNPKVVNPPRPKSPEATTYMAQVIQLKRRFSSREELLEGRNYCKVSGGYMEIVDGEYSGRRAVFHNINLYIWGHQLNQTDLNHVMKVNDAYIVEVCEDGSKFNSGEEQLRIKIGWMGEQVTEPVLPRDSKPFTNWLLNRSLTYTTFKEWIEGGLPRRPFFPFPATAKDPSHVGKIVSILHGQRSDCVGLVLLESGPLAGKTIIFERDILYLCGVHVGMIDLRLIMRPGEKIICQLQPASNADRKKFRSLFNKGDLPEFSHVAIQAYLGPNKPESPDLAPKDSWELRQFLQEICMSVEEFEQKHKAPAENNLKDTAIAAKVVDQQKQIEELLKEQKKHQELYPPPKQGNLMSFTSFGTVGKQPHVPDLQKTVAASTLTARAMMMSSMDDPRIEGLLKEDIDFQNAVFLSKVLTNALLKRMHGHMRQQLESQFGAQLQSSLEGQTIQVSAAEKKLAGTFPAAAAAAAATAATATASYEEVAKNVLPTAPGVANPPSAPQVASSTPAGQATADPVMEAVKKHAGLAATQLQQQQVQQKNDQFKPKATTIMKTFTEYEAKLREVNDKKVEATKKEASAKKVKQMFESFKKTKTTLETKKDEQPSGQNKSPDRSRDRTTKERSRDRTRDRSRDRTRNRSREQSRDYDRRDHRRDSDKRSRFQRDDEKAKRNESAEYERTLSPIELLRFYTMNEKKIAMKNNLIWFGDIAVTLKTRSNFQVTSHNPSLQPDYYSMYALYYFMQNYKLGHSHYVRRATELGIQPVQLDDKLNVIAYLTGEKAHVDNLSSKTHQELNPELFETEPKESEYGSGLHPGQSKEEQARILAEWKQKYLKTPANQNRKSRFDQVVHPEMAALAQQPASVTVPLQQPTGPEQQQPMWGQAPPLVRQEQPLFPSAVQGSAQNQGLHLIPTNLLQQQQQQQPQLAYPPPVRQRSPSPMDLEVPEKESPVRHAQEARLDRDPMRPVVSARDDYRRMDEPPMREDMLRSRRDFDARPPGNGSHIGERLPARVSPRGEYGGSGRRSPAMTRKLSPLRQSSQRDEPFSQQWPPQVAAPASLRERSRSPPRIAARAPIDDDRTRSMAGSYHDRDLRDAPSSRTRAVDEKSAKMSMYEQDRIMSSAAPVGSTKSADYDPLNPTESPPSSPLRSKYGNRSLEAESRMSSGGWGRRVEGGEKEWPMRPQEDLSRRRAYSPEAARGDRIVEREAVSRNSGGGGGGGSLYESFNRESGNGSSLFDSDRLRQAVQEVKYRSEARDTEYRSAGRVGPEAQSVMQRSVRDDQRYPERELDGQRRLPERESVAAASRDDFRERELLEYKRREQGIRAEPTPRQTGTGADYYRESQPQPDQRSLPLGRDGGAREYDGYDAQRERELRQEQYRRQEESARQRGLEEGGGGAGAGGGPRWNEFSQQRKEFADSSSSYNQPSSLEPRRTVRQESHEYNPQQQQQQQQMLLQQQQQQQPRPNVWGSRY